MTPERLGTIKHLWSHYQAAMTGEYVPELIVAVERLQSEREKMLRLLRWAANYVLVPNCGTMQDPENKQNARELRELLEEDREQA